MTGVEIGQWDNLVAAKDYGRWRVARFQSGVFCGSQWLVEVVEALEAAGDDGVVHFDCKCIARHSVLKLDLKHKIKIKIISFHPDGHICSLSWSFLLHTCILMLLITSTNSTLLGLVAFRPTLFLRLLLLSKRWPNVTLQGSFHHGRIWGFAGSNESVPVLKT